MGNSTAISRIYHSCYKLIEGHADFLETKAAVKKFKDHMPDKQWMELEDSLLNVTAAFELQGFIFGFRYAVELLAE